MHAYLHFALRSFRRAITYRAATLAGMATNFFFGLVRAMIFAAFYEAALSPPDMPVEQAISYVWLVQVILGLGFWPFWSDPFVADIRTGAVAMQLIRPVDYQGCWFANSFARLLQMTLMRGAPIGILAMVLGSLRPPPDVQSAVLFVASVGAGMVLAVALAQVTGATAFWTLDATGPAGLMSAVTMFFSGQLVPLALWPAWPARVAHLLPFQGLTDIPLSIYLGRYAGAGALNAIGLQLLWAAAMLLVARALISRGFRHLEIQGG